MSSHRIPLSSEETTLEAGGGLPKTVLFGGAAALLGGIGTVVLGMGDGSRFFHSYLVAFLFGLSIALGALFFVLVQYITRAGWSIVVRRVAEHMMGTLPLFVLLFVPVALGIHELYHWSHEDAVAADAMLRHKAPYLQSGRFLAFAAVFLLGWSALGWWYRSRSLAQDDEGGTSITAQLQRWAPLGMIFFAISSTLASIDWVMSLDPHWYSTIFGAYFFAGSVVAVLSMLSIALIHLQRRGRLTTAVTAEHYHDIGKLLLGFTAFWGYIAFSQFMLIWYANIPEETLWYAQRLEHGWQGVTVTLAVGHFLIPFFFLLAVAVKRNQATLYLASAWLLLMHYVDLYWLVMPVFRPEEGFHPHLLDLTTLLFVAGCFLAAFGLLLRKGHLLPVSDPRLAESLAFENA